MKTTITLTQKNSAAIAIDALPRLKLLAMASARLRQTEQPVKVGMTVTHKSYGAGKIVGEWGSQRSSVPSLLPKRVPDARSAVFTLGRCCDASCTNTQRWEASPEARATAVLIAVRGQLVALDQIGSEEGCRTVILTPTTSLFRMCKRGNYSGVAPERCLKISTAILSACRCLSNDEISNSIRAIAAINPPSTTGGSLLGLAGNSSGAAAGTAGSLAAPAPAAVVLRYCLDHLRNDRMLTPSSLARSFAGTPPVCSRCTAATLKFSSTFFRALLLGIS